jgi:hypothetical protein
MSGSGGDQTQGGGQQSHLDKRRGRPGMDGKLFHERPSQQAAISPGAVPTEMAAIKSRCDRVADVRVRSAAARQGRSRRMRPGVCHAVEKARLQTLDQLPRLAVAAQCRTRGGIVNDILFELTLDRCAAYLNWLSKLRDGPHGLAFAQQCKDDLRSKLAEDERA